ncbi:SAM-dependent methyltransferase [Cystobacter fuscus]|uniref:SAM-dependent methyltransferase n=1 Tax=Cystobacter fuscus TaxID=43 RepID=A0A250JH01_9BACT|nr:50S ribosomal protein L11 methyltransferase [Cystobacter fuscus]ATB42900.1 SAM-dependent methyltransferase [Cystobacter fuscus]
MIMTNELERAFQGASAEAPYDSLETFEKVLALRLPSEDSSAINRVYRRMIPRWHFAMLNDTERNRTFHEALRAQVAPGQLVLDVGTGSGLLAMMAVRAGARAAVSCEVLEPIAHMARRIIAANDLSERVSVLSKSSFDLSVGRDLPTLADVLVTETIDCGLLGEGILPIVHHAREHLLRPEARIIPARARIVFALLESSAIHRNNFVFEASGFDVSMFNHFSTREYFPVRLVTWDHTLLSIPTKAFDFDFREFPPTSRVTRVPVEVRQSGTVHGIVFWFELDLGDGVHLSNAPSNPRSHWMQAVLCFERPLHFDRGATAVVEAAHDATSVWFNIHPPIERKSI